MISSVAISVLIGRFPEMKTTDPYSPSARANASVKPVSSAGMIAGSMTRRKICQRLRRGCGGFLDVDREILQHRLHGAHDERQADERERQNHAERRERDANARALEQRPSTPSRE